MGRRKKRSAALRFDSDLVQHVQALAAREQRPPDELASALLAQALNEHQLAEEALAIWHTLTPRERDVAALICLRYSTQQVAARLVISPETVKSHMRSILAKFGVPNRAELRRCLDNVDFSAWE